MTLSNYSEKETEEKYEKLRIGSEQVSSTIQAYRV